MIYTALSGNIDKPREDIKCFTTDVFFDERMNAKLFKVLSHKFTSGTSIWVDANIELLIPEDRLINEWLDGYDMAVFKHTFRKDVYEEGELCSRLYPEYSDKIDEQMVRYKEEGFEGGIMAECGVLVRRNNPTVNQFNEAWWAEICRWSPRDQISFPYVASKFPIKINYINGNVRQHNYFKYTKHID